MPEIEPTVFKVLYVKAGLLFGQRDFLTEALLSHFLLVGLALVEMSPAEALQVLHVPEFVVPRVASFAAYLCVVYLFGYLLGDLLALELHPALGK